MVENLLKYGLRLSFIQYVRMAMKGKGNLPLVLCFPTLLLFPLVALGIEWLALFLLKRQQKVRRM